MLQLGVEPHAALATNMLALSLMGLACQFGKIGCAWLKVPSDKFGRINAVSIRHTMAETHVPQSFQP